MVELNISGKEPTQGKPDYEAARAKVEARQAPSKKQRESDFDAALRQQSRQAQEQAQESSRVFRDRQRASRRVADADARLARVTEREVQLRERQLMAEQRLQHRYRLLEHRAGAPLTPSSWNAWQRSMSTLTFQSMQHQQTWGSTPFSADMLRNLRASTGTEAGAHAVARTMRLGNIGQHMAMKGQFYDLAKVRHELKHIDKTLQKQFRFQDDPMQRGILQWMQQQIYVPKERIMRGLGFTGSKGSSGSGGGGGGIGHAPGRPPSENVRAIFAKARQEERHNRMIDLSRQKAAHEQAQQRINAGLAGHPRWKRTLGIAGGEAGLLVSSVMSNPIVAGSLAAAGMLYEGGSIINSGFANIISQGDPYREAKARMDRWAMATGLNPSAVQRSLMPFGIKSYAPGFEMTGSENRWGYSATEAERWRQSYGVAPHSATGLAHLASTTRWAETLPGMNLSAESLVTGAGFAKSVFGLTPAQYFQQLFRVSATATQQGLNNSQVAQGFQALLGAAAGSGPTSVGLLSRYYSHMIAGGPLMRNGGAMSFAAANRQQMGNFLGANPLAQGGVMGFLAHHGMAGTASAFEKEFHVSASQFQSLMKGGGSKLWAAAQAARKAGDTALYAQYMTALLQNDPRELDYMLKHSGMPAFTNPVFGMTFRAGAMGVTVSQLAGYEAARNSKITNAPYPSKHVARDIMRWASHYGIPMRDAFALIGKESGFNAHAVNGSHIGLGQVGPAALADFNKAHGTHFTSQDLLNPNVGARVSMWYFHQQHKRFGYWGRSYQAYHYGAAGGTNSADEAHYKAWVNRESGVGNFLKQHGLIAQGQQARFKGAESAANSYKTVVDAVDAGLRLFKDGLHDATKSVERFAKVLDGVSTPNRRYNESRFGFAPYHGMQAK